MLTPDLAPHQLKAIEELGNGKVLCGGVGSGKSRTALGYYAKREAPRDIYIITTAKKRDSLDWQQEAAGFGISTVPDYSVAGILHVDSWNNINKYLDVENAFFIFDEQRLVGSGLWVKTFHKIAKRNRWILLSATPGDTWLDYIPVFVANGFYKNTTEFKRTHVVYNTHTSFPKVERYVGVPTLVRLRNQVLVDMPLHRATIRHLVEVVVDYHKDLFESSVRDRWNPFLNEPMKDVAELFRVMRRIANSDPSRVRAVRALLERHPRLIVFYNFDYELEELRREFGQPQTTSLPTTDRSQRESIDCYGVKSSEVWIQTKSEPLQNELRCMKPDATTSECPWTDSMGCACSAILNSDSTLHHPSAKSLNSDQMRPEFTSSTNSTTTDDGCSKSPSSNQSTGQNKSTSGKLPSSSEQLSSKHEWDLPESTSKSTTGNTGVPPKSESSTTTSTATSASYVNSRDPWEGTIWSQSYKPIPGMPDPRESTRNQIKKYEYERLSRRQTSHGLPTMSTPSSATDQGSSSPRQNSSASDAIALAEWNGHKHEAIPDSHRWVYLVQYTAGAEGWNCVTTDAICFYSLSYSYRLFEQAQGRIDRLNTPFIDLYYYVLKSDSLIDKAIWKVLQKKQSFNERKSKLKV